MTSHKHLGCSYISRVYDAKSLIKDAKEDLSSVKFDTIVGTGLSGGLIVPRLAEALKVKWAIVRREGDSSHSPSKIEGYLGRRWLFVDDLIDSGVTYGRVKKVVREEAASTRVWNDKTEDYAYGWKTKHIGSWCYNHRELLLIND